MRNLHEVVKLLKKVPWCRLLHISHPPSALVLYTRKAYKNFMRKSIQSSNTIFPLTSAGHQIYDRSADDQPKISYSDQNKHLPFLSTSY